jgi:hypothetical protein
MKELNGKFCQPDMVGHKIYAQGIKLIESDQSQSYNVLFRLYIIDTFTIF